jgi:hypothetical protein
MFLFNVGGKSWSLASEVEEVRGALFLAASHPNVRFTRRAGPDLTRVLLDPQIYLATLDRAACSKACGRLASHPWFCVPDVPEFDSSVSGAREWQKQVANVAAKSWPGKPPRGKSVRAACRFAIECQLGFGCTHIILPAPLIEEREDEGATVAEWLDEGVAVAEELAVAQPLLATVAISDATLNDDAFATAGFLDALVDQVTARDGLAGVYVVVAQTGGAIHPYQTNAKVNHAYLHLSKAFHTGGIETVLVNFADLFGFVCAAVGASDMATGASQSQRRLTLGAFRDEGHGVALPYFYSNRVIGEFSTEQDLGKLVAGRLLRRVADETHHSQELMEALANGGSAANLPAWAESQNNTTAAQKHFIARLALEGAKLKNAPLSKRMIIVRDWLEDADAGALYLKNRLGIGVGRIAPAAGWLALLDAS